MKFFYSFSITILGIFFLSDSVFSAKTLEKLDIHLTVHEALREGIKGTDRFQEPVSVGLPFPRGVLQEINGLPQLSLRGADECQFRTLAKWPDGSVRWALVDFQTYCPAEKMTRTVKVIRKIGNLPYKPIGEDKGEKILINTGLMRVEIKKKEFNLFDRVVVLGKEIISPAISKGIVCQDAEGRKYTAFSDPLVRVMIEQNGPVKCVVKAEGTHTSIDRKRMMDYTVRMYFYKGKSRVKVDYTLRNASNKQVEHPFIQCLELVSKLNIFGNLKATVSTHQLAMQKFLTGNEELTYYQAVSGFPQKYDGASFYWHAPIPADPTRKKEKGFVQEGYWIRLNGRNIVAGKKSEYPDFAFIDISDRKGTGVTVGIRFAAGNWPKSLRANADGTIMVGLWPKENETGYWIRYGSHNTFEIMYDFHDKPNDPIISMKKFQYPLIAKASVDWYNRNVEGIYPLYHFISFADERNLIKVMGWEYKVWHKPKMHIWRYHYWGHGGFLNQHDIARISLVNFLRETHDPFKAGEYYLYADTRFHYNTDWAVYHSDDYDLASRNYGKWKIWKPEKNLKKVDLAKVVYEWEHPHWYGLSLYYYMTGKERIKEAILDWAEYIKRTHEEFRYALTYGRVFGWGMYTLAAMYDFTGDTSFMKMANKNFLRLLDAKLDSKNPARNIFIDWDRGYIAGGPATGWGKNPALKPGLITGYIIFDGLYNYYLNMDEKIPLKEKVVDVLEGISEFMYREPYVEGEKRGHWAFWLPYIYNLADKSKSDHGYRLVLQAFYANLASYLSNGEDRWLKRMAKLVRMAAWDRAGLWEGFGYMDHPGMQSILYLLWHPKKDKTPPPPVQSLSAKVYNHDVILSWIVPDDAVRYQIKYSSKKLVKSLEYDPNRKYYKYNPNEYTNWWAGENIPNEPTPSKAGERQGCLIKDLKPGHYYFAIRSWDNFNNRSNISSLAEVEIR